jgi:hypothetical protein
MKVFEQKSNKTVSMRAIVGEAVALVHQLAAPSTVRPDPTTERFAPFARLP